MRWLRIPLVHFLVGGAVLFRLVHAGIPAALVERVTRVAPVTIAAADVAIMRTAYTRETGLPATPADEVALIDRAIDEELLFREALARGLDRHDRSVRNWLVEQMRAVTEDREANADDLYAQARALELDRKDLVVRRILVQKMRLLASRAGERDASDDELRAFYAQHESDYRQPDRITFWHVFLRSGSDAPDAPRRAARLLATLRSNPEGPADSAPRGDPFPLPPRFALQARPQLEKLFGASFADEVARLEPGSWCGPVVSPYGLHLVWVEAREPGVVPPLESVRGRVLERWREERHAQRLAELMRELRGRYPLHVESAAWRERSHV
jgi:PPIC-type PPIASE domain